MADLPPLLGVSTSPPPPAGEPGPLLPLPSPAAPEPPLWPPAAQHTLAVLIVLFIALLAWHGYGRSPYRLRPLDLERGGALAVVDLNRAGEADLRLLPGLGDVLAPAVLRDREANGPFRSVDDLTRVRGIGPATLARLRPFVTVDAPSAGPPPRVARGAAPRDGDPPTTRKPPPPEPIDLNAATEPQLRQLPGIGPTLAARILAARQARPFTSVDDLRLVKGIGARTLDKLRPHVRVGP